MRECERWYLPDKDIYTNEYEMQKRAWKAALEWALTTQGRFDWRFSAMISPSIIRKELDGVEK